MKTKEQILDWLDKQPWANEFYKTAFLRRVNLYNDDRFISCAFIWKGTEQGIDVWEKRDEEFRKWYDDDKPKSWEEYCKQNPIKANEYYINEFSNFQKVAPQERNDIADINVMPEGLCEAFLAYMKLIQLRNAWTKDHVDEDCFHKIAAKKGIISRDAQAYFSFGLSFPTPEMADDFMKTFKDLLEVAKPLL